MSYDDLAAAEERSMRHLASTVLDQISAGRPVDEIVRELQGNGWPLEEAKEFVAKLEENRGEFANRLELRFPDMRPIRQHPVLFTVNGIGTAMYGARGQDMETGTYVKTWCVCFVFVPVLALASFRVAPAGDRGWYFLGKVPLSRLAKAWNLCVLLGILAVVGGTFWKSHTESPEYVARKKLQQAESQCAAGHLPAAARLFGQVMQSGTSCTSEAREKLITLAESPTMTSLSPTEITGVFSNFALGRGGDGARIFAAGAVWIRKFASETPQESVRLLQTLWQVSPDDARQLLTELVQGPFQELPAEPAPELWRELLTVAVQPEERDTVVAAGTTWIEKHATADPRGALAVADQIAAPLQPVPEALEQIRRQLIEQSVLAAPQDAELAVRLALQLELEGQTTRIKDLLAPHREQLGSSEGARLLGHMLADEGEFDAAYALLSAYLEPRLAELHKAQVAFEQAISANQQSILTQLKNGFAPDFDYTRLETLAEDEREAMIREYFDRRLRDDPSIIAARESLLQQASVVPAAVELGIVTLRRAQSMTDADAQRVELQKAEKTFLAVQGIAGDDANYQLHIGQVYYWLGKHAEGQQQFEQLLKDADRSPESLLTVASVLREIGAYSEARQYIDEAYEKAAEESVRHDAAGLRAVTTFDSDEKVVWLERCDQNDQSVRAQLVSARGLQAEAAGDIVSAAEQYRQAISIYDRLPESHATLNNSAIVCQQLYGVTGDPNVLKDTVRRLERGIALDPDSVFLLGNCASALLRTVVNELAGVEGEAARCFGDFDDLDYVVKSQAELDQMRAAARHKESLTKALSYLDTTMVLAPRSVSSYTAALGVYRFLHDQEALQQLALRMEQSNIDVEEPKKQYLEYYRHEEDPEEHARLEKKRATLATEVEKYHQAGNSPVLALNVAELLRYTMLISDLAEVDVDHLVQLAEAAHATSPSLGTYSTLNGALMFRAHRSLAQAYPEYAATDSARRSLGPSLTVTLVLAHQSDLGAAARSNADVQRVGSLVKEQVQLFPSSISPWTWALLKGLGDPAADPMAAAIKDDKMRELSRKCSQILVPVAPYNSCYDYWTLLADGQVEAAQNAFRQVRELGVAIPDLLVGEGDK